MRVTLVWKSGKVEEEGRGGGGGEDKGEREEARRSTADEAWYFPVQWVTV